MKKGKIIVFVGPSGTGKSTIEKELFKDKKLGLEFSISATTRKPRYGELEGKDYYFITKKEFELLISKGEFVEWSNHFDSYYGTLKSEIERIITNSKHAFLEIETYGAIQIFNKINKSNIISIFLKPPSMKELEERIQKRGTETKLQIIKRLQKAQHEVGLASLFNYVVINNDLEKTIKRISSIILRNS